MVVKIETQARKKPKLNRYMDVMDFQMILLTIFVIPFFIWYLTGMPGIYVSSLGVLYILWMLKFKIDKPSGYWRHWVSFHLRGKNWSARGDTYPKKLYQNLKLP